MNQDDEDEDEVESHVQNNPRAHNGIIINTGKFDSSISDSE